MFNEYGEKMTYLEWPTIADYVIDHYPDSIKTIEHGTYKTCRAYNAAGCGACGRWQFNRDQAVKFAQNNDMILISDVERDGIYYKYDEYGILKP